MTKERVQKEDALKHLHDCEYQGQVATPQSLAGVLSLSLDQAERLLADLEADACVVRQEGVHRLSPRGLEYARQIIRAHRVYETHLAQETGLSQTRWHEEAERKEHELSGEKVERLARQLGEPRYDPHGDPIPTVSGELPPRRGIPLLECPPGWEGEVAHIEDEPRGGYLEVVRAGLAVGTRIRLLATATDGVRLQADGTTVCLSRSAAGHVLVRPFRPSETFDPSIQRLSSLREGESAEVVGLAPNCVGPERNRLLDLGVVPGTVIQVDLRSPSGNPIGYLIRGATIALRREQADRILIRKR